MAETVDAGSRRRPDADAYWRSGLTQAEAIRRERVERWRDETQSPWEASPPGLVAWLAWRAVYKGFQPLWLILSLLAAAWFGSQWLASKGGIEAVSDPQPVQSGDLLATVAGAVPAGEDAAVFWTSRLEDALDGDRRRRPDIDRFRAWAALGPDLIGRERLALEGLAGPAGAEALDARLRAGPPWEREQRLAQAFEDRLGEGEAQGLEPPELIFAPERIRQRYDRSQFQWSIAATSADAFFRGRVRGEFEMRSLPGLVVAARAGANTRLYGGVRHLVIQACAHDPDAMDSCAAPIIPTERADAVGYGLAAIEAGLARLNIPPGEASSGAEILQAARRAGRLSPALEADLASRMAVLLPPETISQSLAAAGVRADLAFAAPDQVRPVLAGAIDLRARDGAVVLSQMLRDIAAIRRRTSPAVAIRLLDGIASPDMAGALRALVAEAGPRALALQEIAAESGLAAAAGPAGPGTVDRVARRNTMLALFAAALVVLLTLIRLATPPRIRLAARTNLADAWISRLTLGRKT